MKLLLDEMLSPVIARELRERGHDVESVAGAHRVAVFAEDVAIRRYAEQANNIVHWSDFDTGGHFAALETPGLLVQDIRAFFASLPS